MDKKKLIPRCRFFTCAVQTNWLGQCQCYCVIEAGQREVGKTRPQKLTAGLSWEQPEERFRLTISPLQNAPNTITTAAGDAGEPGATTVRPDGRYCQRPHDELAPPLGCDLTTSEPVLSPGCDLTISVWSKRVIGGNRDLLGTATVPSHYIDHPPGDVRLALQESASRDEAPTGDVSRNRADKDADRAEEEQRGKKTSKSLLPASTKRNKGNGSSWGGGLFKTLRGEKEKGRGKDNKEHGRHQETIGSVHVWLGKAIRSSSSGQQPGKGVVTLRVHAAAGLRKV